MRITNNSMYAELQRQLVVNGRQLMAAQERVSTQKRINRLSDDPVDGGRVLDLKGLLDRTSQFLANGARTSALASVQEETVGQAGDLITRAKELLVAESNQVTSTSATRESVRIEMSMLLSQMIQLGNTRYDGAYVFSGFAANTPAFADATAATVAGGANTGGAAVQGSEVVDVTKLTYDQYQIQFTAPGVFSVVNTTDSQTVLAGQAYTSGQAILFDGMAITLANTPGAPAAGDVFNVSLTPPGAYQGDSQTQMVEIQQGSKVAQNLTGDRVFGGVGVSGGADVFDVLQRVGRALEANDRTAMDQLIGELDGAKTQLSNERSRVGAKMILLDQVKTLHEDVKLRLDTLRSDLEDMDIAEAITEFNKQQTGYEATLGSAAKVIQPSLLDFLR